MCEMDRLQEELSGIIAGILTNSLIGSCLPKNLTYLAYRFVRNQFLGNEDLFKKAVSDISKSIAKDIVESISPNAATPGNAISAIRDLNMCIKVSNLSLAKLFELNLDKEKISRYILNHHPEIRANPTALTERHNIVRMGTESFSNHLLSVAPNLPGFELLLAQNLIRTNREVVSILEELRIKQDS